MLQNFFVLYVYYTHVYIYVFFIFKLCSIYFNFYYTNTNIYKLHIATVLLIVIPRGIWIIGIQYEQKEIWLVYFYLNRILGNPAQ